VIQRTLVCVSANVSVCINDCSNKLADDDHTRRNPHQSALNTMKKPLTILSVLIVAALTMGMAVAQHMEQRAQQDRLSFGDTAQ
jgi:hypothetical protein